VPLAPQQDAADCLVAPYEFRADFGLNLTEYYF